MTAFSPYRVPSAANRRTSVMFSAQYESGRTAYFVIASHGSAERDFLALTAAKERQRKGELPEGVIVRVKRVR
jgi:hypothetical protein